MNHHVIMTEITRNILQFIFPISEHSGIEVLIRFIFQQTQGYEAETCRIY